MDPNTIVLIEKGLETALALGPVAVDAALKIKHLLELDPDFKVNLKNLTDEAISIDQDTIDAIETWKATLKTA
jgi:hypothetical protein